MNAVLRALARRLALPLLALLALWVVGSSVFWLYRSYTPVPTLDMWPGYVDFAVRAAAGDWAVWFANHNEHRIVLPRVLYYIDFWVFSGQGIFLIAMILALQSLNTALLVVCCEQCLPPFRHRRLILGCLITVATFSWLQSENFVWAFQVQFIMLYTFVLAACLLFARAMAEPSALPRQAIAPFGLALCAVGTMVNGLLLLPLLAVWAYVGGKRRLALLYLLPGMVIGFICFNVGYQAPIGFESSTWFAESGLALLRYLLAFMGAPVRVGNMSLTYWVGGLVVILLCWLVYCAARRPLHLVRQPAFWLALFVLATGGVTAIGRAKLGVEQALAWRYVTPVLLAWVCLLALFVRTATHRGLQVLALVSVGCAVVFLAWQQRHGKELQYEEFFRHQQAALSLALQANDVDVELSIIWDADYLHRVSAEARQRKLSVFGVSWVREPVQMLGHPLPEGMLAQGVCAGRIESAVWRAGALLAEGWQGVWHGNRSAVMLLIDDANLVVGGAVTGAPRGLTPTGVPRDALPKNPGWRGYAVAVPQGAIRAAVKLESGKYCFLAGSIVPNQLDSVDLPEHWRRRGALVQRIADTTDAWQPDAYFHGIPKVLPDMLGSFVGGDAFAGDLALTVQTDAQGVFELPYLTGPVAEGLSVEIRPEGAAAAKVFPLSGTGHAWRLLRYQALTKRQQTLQWVLHDRGTGLGQWAAVSLAHEVP